MPLDKAKTDDVGSVLRVLDIVAENVRRLRTELKLSQKDLEEASGVSRSTIRRAENEKKPIGLDHLALIARALNVTPARLLQTKEDEEHLVDDLVDKLADRVADVIEKRRRPGGV